MGAFEFICAAVLLSLLYAIIKWWEKRMEEKENAQEILLSQDEAVRNMMTDALEQSKETIETLGGRDVIGMTDPLEPCKETIMVMDERFGTRDLFFQTLPQIGCQYEISEDENCDIQFAYQGENFLVKVSNDCAYIQIFDTNWGHVELYDIDELTRLKKAINESNLRNSVTTVYTIDEAGSNVNVHSKSVILFIPEIPDLVNYLRLELSEYFRVHEIINLEMAKQREQEKEK